MKKLSIKGNKFIESSLIKNHLSLKAGKPYSLEKIKKDVRSLYALGFFEDVEVFKKILSKNSVNILYRIKERPLVGKIKFEGNKALSEEDLKELLEVKEFEFVSFQALESTLTAVKKKYKEKGYFLSEVSYKIKPLKKGKGKVQLVVQIKEKEKVVIKKINFIGNRHFSSKKLKSLMMTRQQGFFSFLDSSGVYNPLYLDRDLQMLEFLYRDKGYLNVRLEKPEISLTPNKKHIYISLTIHEGQRFSMGLVNFQGDEVVSKEKALSLIDSGKGEFFSLGTMIKDLRTIEDLYKEEGYAFAKAIPEVLPDQSEENKVHVSFQVEKGAIYKVGKINVFGNKNTRDKVILRQFSLKEGSRYKKSHQDQSEALVTRLGFFEEVNLKLKKEDLSKEKTLDVEVHVKEREHTGEAQLAGGYNSLHKIFIKGGLKKSNFLGLGHSFSVNLLFSRLHESFNLNYHIPYLLDTDWSLSMDVFNIGQDMLSGYGDSFFSQAQERLLSYSQMNRGFAFSVGRHITDYFSSSLKYRLQQQFLSGDSFLLSRKIFGEPPKTEKDDLRDLVNNILPLKDGEGVLSSLSGIFEYDKRNDRYYTTKGYFGRLSLEYAGLGGDFKHTKIQGNLNFYTKLFWKFVLKNSMNYGIVFSNDKKKEVLFTERFLLGGPYSLRGFTPNTVGPRKYSEDIYNYAVKKGFKNPSAVAHYPYGGTKMFFYNLELEAPLISQARIFGALFFDIGEAANNFTFDFDRELRANIGAGIRWRAPMGLVRLDWGIPFFPKKKLGEERLQFQFSIGSSF